MLRRIIILILSFVFFVHCSAQPSTHTHTHTIGVCLGSVRHFHNYCYLYFMCKRVTYLYKKKTVSAQQEKRCAIFKFLNECALFLTHTNLHRLWRDGQRVDSHSRKTSCSHRIQWISSVYGFARFQQPTTEIRSSLSLQQPTHLTIMTKPYQYPLTISVVVSPFCLHSLLLCSIYAKVTSRAQYK